LEITPGGGFAAGPSINLASSSGDILGQMHEDNLRRGMSSFVRGGRRAMKPCDAHSKGVAIVEAKEVYSSEGSGDSAGTGGIDVQTQVMQRRKPYCPRHGLIFHRMGITASLFLPSREAFTVFRQWQIVKEFAALSGWWAAQSTHGLRLHCIDWPC
jgi:hypothetical protein